MIGADNGFNDRNDENAEVDTSLAASPDGRCFATAAYKCDIALWDSHTGTHITTVEQAGVYSLEFLATANLYLGTTTGKYHCGTLSLAHVSGTRTATEWLH